MREYLEFACWLVGGVVLVWVASYVVLIGLAIVAIALYG